MTQKIKLPVPNNIFPMENVLITNPSILNEAIKNRMPKD